MTATYYSHIEHNQNGKSAAAQNFAEQNISEIKNRIAKLTEELKFWEHVVVLTSATVCQSCRGEQTIKWLPSGASRGMGWHTSVPCPTCKPDEYKKKTKELQRQFDGDR